MIDPSQFEMTRASYDTVAADYTELVGDLFTRIPVLDRALLGVFADLVRSADRGPVADIGCGPGHVTAHLNTLGTDVFGIDLSPGMIDVARRRHPRLRFEVGSMTDLDGPDASLGGVLAWYSTVHMPADLLPTVYAEFRRVLAPGGHLLTGFKIGGDSVHLDHAYGHDLSLDVHRHPMALVVAALGEAGLVVDTQVVREPDGYEKTPQGFVLARRPTTRK